MRIPRALLILVAVASLYAQQRTDGSTVAGRMPAYSLACPPGDSGVRSSVLALVGAADNTTLKYRHALRALVERTINSRTSGEPCCILEPAMTFARGYRGARSDAARNRPSLRTQSLLALLDSLLEAQRIDPDRLYLAGFSSDTYGVWDLLQRRPALFAAAVPIGWGGDRALAHRLAKVPIWSHHGSPGMVKALERAGGHPRFTEGRTLEPWADSSSLRRELEWMLGQKRTTDQVGYARFLSEQLPAPLAAPVIPVRERFHLFLLIGQSNMAGRGRVGEEDRTCHPRVLVFDKQNTWKLGSDPLHFDRPVAGVGPGLSFGKELARLRDTVTVGLIPCAVGETTIDDWQRDSRKIAGNDNLYRTAVRRARLAMATGTLKGILWHQGESNNFTGGLADYEALLLTLVRDIRGDLGAPGVPFVLGEIAQSRAGSEINRVIGRIPQVAPNTAFVSSRGLNAEGLHFDTPGYRELGRRYARSILSFYDRAGEGLCTTKGE